MERSLRDELLTVREGQWITVQSGDHQVTVQAIRRTLYLDCFLVSFQNPKGRQMGIVPFENVVAWGLEPPEMGAVRW